MFKVSYVSTSGVLLGDSTVNSGINHVPAVGTDVRLHSRGGNGAAGTVVSLVTNMYEGGDTTVIVTISVKEKW